MSKLIATNKLNETAWEFSFEKNDSYNIELCFEIKGNEIPVFFDNLRFGYSLILDNKIVKQRIYPSSTEKYSSSDQKFIATDLLKVKPTLEYTLNVWRENAGGYTEESTTIITEQPTKPFESWIWENYVWIAPVSYPNDNKTYSWDEENQSWDEVEQPK